MLGGAAGRFLLHIEPAESSSDLAWYLIPNHGFFSHS
jgi:hypothetical protein